MASHTRYENIWGKITCDKSREREEKIIECSYNTPHTTIHDNNSKKSYVQIRNNNMSLNGYNSWRSKTSNWLIVFFHLFPLAFLIILRLYASRVWYDTNYNILNIPWRTPIFAISHGIPMSSWWNRITSQEDNCPSHFLDSNIVEIKRKFKQQNMQVHESENHKL